MGSLGDGTTVRRRLTPVDVIGLSSGVSQIAAGFAHACALLVSGGVRCWGYNLDGQLGDGTTTHRRTPVDASGLASSVAHIEAGMNHTCAVMIAGSVKCWGENAYSQLGDGTEIDRHLPTDASTLSASATRISLGFAHTCALTTTSGIKCWGGDFLGQLSNGSATSHTVSTVPVDVVGLTSGVVQIDAGHGHTCALRLSAASSAGAATSRASSAPAHSVRAAATGPPAIATVPSTCGV